MLPCEKSREHAVTSFAVHVGGANSYGGSVAVTRDDGAVESCVEDVEIETANARSSSEKAI